MTKIKRRIMDNLKEEQKFLEEIVKEVEQDFERRQKERVRLERQWELNMNFYANNQYCGLTSRGEITEEDKDFYWQSRAVYNHITPLIEMRLAKFSKVTPVLTVKPSDDDDDEISNAKMGERLINYAFRQKNIESVIKDGTTWSEICGTSFYKVMWDNEGGKKIGEVNGKDIYEGDIKVVVVPPFEIFPDSLYTESINEQRSIIHARAMNVEEVYERYGVEVEGKDIDVFCLTKDSTVKKYNGTQLNVKHNNTIIIERYELPTQKYPNGRLVIVAGGKLLYYGELPYLNGENGRRTYPFIKQVSCSISGSFFGVSIIERLIPLQREYNAVKNRKHEFLNRLSMGIITVEDGSMDTDDLVDEGLSPGKVLIYRQGSNPPTILNETAVPDSFSEEEDKLLKEFSLISGVTDVLAGNKLTTVSSGTAFQLLIEQSNERLTVTAENIRNSYLLIAKHILRLYRQFVRGVRTVKEVDSFSQVKMYYVDQKSMTSDDVVLESENELLLTPLQKKEAIMSLYQSGLLNSKDGSIKSTVKEKVIKLLGYKELTAESGITALHEQKAESENQLIKQSETGCEDADDHDIHIECHTRYLLAEYEHLTKEQKDNVLWHIRAHKDEIIKEGLLWNEQTNKLK